MKVGIMLRNKQNSPTKFKSLTEVDEKVPYEEMGTLLVVILLVFLLLVHLMVEYGPDSAQEAKNCTCKN